MTTVREARVQVARQAILNADEYLRKGMATHLANAVVDALFTPDPLIDNAVISHD